MRTAIRIGDLEVAAVLDGTLRLPGDIIRDVPEGGKQLLSAARGSGDFVVPVNCFVARNQAETWVIDAGAGSTMGEGLGRLPDTLAQRGVDCRAVDHVLLTHLHPDHVDGLLGPGGNRTFPSARIHIHEAEAAYWLDTPITDDVPAIRRSRMSANRTILAAYRDQITRVADGAVFPGIGVSLFPGHSPGHACWTIEREGAAVIFCGDLLHVPALQCAYPEISVIYDFDAEVAVASRRRFLARYADTPTIIGGAHIDGFRRLRRADRSYELTDATG